MINKVFPLADIHFCWWQKNENMRKHFQGPLAALGEKIKREKKESEVVKKEPAASNLSIDQSFELLPQLNKGKEKNDDYNSSSSSLLDSASHLFYWIRRAPTDTDVNLRLDHLKELLPTTASYIDSHLRPTIRYWALCYQVGHLTFGLISTSVQESLHASFKAMLAKKKVPIHRLVEFFRDWFKKRRRNLKLKINKTRRLKTENLEEMSKDFGDEKLAQDIKLYLTEEGERLVLAELKESYMYKPAEPITRDEAEIRVKVKDVYYYYKY